MKVILLRDVAKIGRRFEVVNVPDGFALNRLIPQKDAEPATPVNIKRLEQRRNRLQTTQESQTSELKTIAETIAQEPLVITAEANEHGHLFQAIHASDVINSAKARNIDIPLAAIEIKETIKDLGEYKITLKNKELQLEVPIVVKTK
ncbi:MAG: 50S ribosomal protein L9 [Candidatus Nomurabacteria bacterium]|nr:MAG: 50S ribosomal protein L9 [Candidatus Nomurabacteria bacterium]